MSSIGERAQLVDEGPVPGPFDQLDEAVLGLRRQRIGAVLLVAHLALGRNRIALELADQVASLELAGATGVLRYPILFAAVEQRRALDLALDRAGGMLSKKIAHLTVMSDRTYCQLKSTKSLESGHFPVRIAHAATGDVARQKPIGSEPIPGGLAPLRVTP